MKPRPKLKPQAFPAKITIYCSNEQRDEVVRYADALDMTLSEFCRGLFDAYSQANSERQPEPPIEYRDSTSEDTTAEMLDELEED